VETAWQIDDPAMTTSDYIIDSALVLLVLMQLKERKLTLRQIIRPLIILGVAVANYLHGIPTQGNDLVLILAISAIGGLIGLASGVTVQMRTRGDGDVWFRSGPASAALWVLGMGSRFAFAWWASHGGVGPIATFSAQHSISGTEAWTVALLGMAVFEVSIRTLTVWLRWKQMEGGRRFAVAA
jgi:hypothetical protein